MSSKLMLSLAAVFALSAAAPAVLATNSIRA